MCAGPLLTFLLILPLQSNTGGKILWSFLSEPSQSLAILVTNPLIHCCLVDLNDVTLACEDANSKLVEVVTVADVDAEKRVDDSLVQIWKMKLSQKVKCWFMAFHFFCV